MTSPYLPFTQSEPSDRAVEDLAQAMAGGERAARRLRPDRLALKEGSVGRLSESGPARQLVDAVVHVHAAEDFGLHWPVAIATSCPVG